MNILPAPQVGSEHVISMFDLSKTIHFFNYKTFTFTAEICHFTSYMKNHTSVHTVRLQARINTSCDPLIFSWYVHAVCTSYQLFIRSVVEAVLYTTVITRNHYSCIAVYLVIYLLLISINKKFYNQFICAKEPAMSCSVQLEPRRG
jgi:general stress protein CsbA